MSIRYLAYTVAALLLFVSCHTKTAENSGAAPTPETARTSSDYTANAEAIEQKMQEMLTVSDTAELQGYTYDTSLQSRDPNAYWLMNRMIQMCYLVEDADDDWAWMLAINHSIDEYNKRSGCDNGSVESAIESIYELLEEYYAGYQSQMNTASYINCTAAHYKTLNGYYRIIESIGSHNEDNDLSNRLKALYYNDFRQWFNMIQAMNTLMCEYTYSLSMYSSLPIFLAGTEESWSNNRHEGISIEKKIFLTDEFKPTENDTECTSPEKFKALLDHFKDRTKEKFIKEYSSENGEWHYKQSSKRIDNIDFEKITAAADSYNNALSNWTETREKIALMLPADKQAAYRNVTEKMYTQLYKDLLALKKIDQ